MTAKPDVTSFYDQRTGSIQFVVADPQTKKCVTIDPVLDCDEKSILSELFGLTPTEAEVACALAHGRPTGEIAADLSISPTTVDFRLGNVFEKTGTHRQADLIALILTALASITAPDAGKAGARQ